MRIGRGRPKNAVSHRIAQIGNRKIAKTNFTQRVGTVSGSDTGTSVRARATLRTTLRPRLELRFPRLFVDLSFLAAKVPADYADAADLGKSEIRPATLAL